MSTADGVTVVPDHLTGHADHLDHFASDVAVAADAGQTVELASKAYGWLCNVLPLVMNQLDEMVVQALRHTHASLDETSASLRTAAAIYGQTDEGNSADFDSLRPE